MNVDWKPFTALFLAVGLSVSFGCSKSGRNVGDYTPPSGKARDALEAALNHWKGGNPPGTIPGTSPTVEVVDSRWKAAPKQLQQFEILGEDVTSSDAAPRTFKVRLTMAKGSPQEVKYVVVGIDPLWVYGEKDFESLSGVGK